MSKTQVRRSWAVLGVFALVAGIAGIAAFPSSAAEGFTLDRYAGTDRYDTAKIVAADTYGTSDWVILVSGENFPDALSSGFVAGLGPFPILLTQKDTLPTPTKTAINALGATNALLVGGTSAISAAVEKQLADEGVGTKRVAGTNRYDTAKEAAESGGAGAVGTTGGPLPPASKTAIVVSGEAFPDALSAGPMSFGSHLPLLLTPTATLAPEAKEALTDLAIKSVLIVGGTAAVSQKVEDDIKAMSITVTRLAGTNRSDTSGKVADYELANLKFDATHVDIARGDGFADALAGASHSGKVPAPLLLTQDVNNLSSSTKTWLTNHSDKLEDGHIFGGTAAVSKAVEDEATAAGEGSTSTTSSSSTSSSLTILPSSTSTTEGSTTTTTAFMLPTQPCPPGTTGPGQPFCQADNSAPKFKSASMATTSGSTTITATYTEAVQCSSVDPGPTSQGSKIDYIVNVNGTTLDATVTCGTQPMTSSDTIKITPTSGQPISDTATGFLQARNGQDGNTVTDSSGAAQPAGDKIYFTPPHMKTVKASNGSTKMTITYDQPLDCSSVDADGSDYAIHVASGPDSPADVTDAGFNATCSASTVTLTLTSGNFQTGQSGTVTVKNGTDTNTVKNPAGAAEPAESKSWTV